MLQFLRLPSTTSTIPHNRRKLQKLQKVTSNHTKQRCPLLFHISKFHFPIFISLCFWQFVATEKIASQQVNWPQQATQSPSSRRCITVPALPGAWQRLTYSSMPHAKNLLSFNQLTSWVTFPLSTLNTITLVTPTLSLR